MVFVEGEVVTAVDACLKVGTSFSASALLTGTLMFLLADVVLPDVPVRVTGRATVPRAQMGVLVGPARVEGGALTGPGVMDVEVEVRAGRMVVFVRVLWEEAWLDTEGVISGLTRPVGVVLVAGSESPIRFVVRAVRFVLRLASVVRE
jgi:hypothetical protein